MEFVPIKPKSLVEEVADQLAKFVLALQPGEPEHLPAERKLAEKFGVARGVVREAIKRLEIQGLLEVRQGSGVRAVKQLHKSLNASLEFLLPDRMERLKQATQTRIIIEPDIAATAAGLASPEDADLVSYCVDSKSGELSEFDRLQQQGRSPAGIAPMERRIGWARTLFSN